MIPPNTTDNEGLDEEPMLTLHTTGTEDNILREDLTSIVSDAVEIRKTYYQDLRRLCISNHGYAIAASQVGLRENFFFALATAKFPKKRPGAPPTEELCVNPAWTTEVPAVAMEEGCLSLPGRRFLVARHPVITASWNNAVGHRVTFKLKGLSAEIFQHEYDHLKGILISDHGREVTSEPGE